MNLKELVAYYENLLERHFRRFPVDGYDYSSGYNKGTIHAYEDVIKDLKQILEKGEVE